MWWYERFASWMCNQQICSNCVMLSSQCGPKSEESFQHLVKSMPQIIKCHFIRYTLLVLGFTTFFLQMCLECTTGATVTAFSGKTVKQPQFAFFRCSIICWFPSLSSKLVNPSAYVNLWSIFVVVQHCLCDDCFHSHSETQDAIKTDVVFGFRDSIICGSSSMHNTHSTYGNYKMSFYISKTSKPNCYIFS